MNEFDAVTIDVGYGDDHAIIFRGSIKQFRRGKENNVDSFLEILAADNDLGYNFGVVNKTFSPGTTIQQEMSHYAEKMGATVDSSANDYIAQATGGILPNPRGKVAYGLARSFMRDLANTFNARWSIQDGVLYLIPLNGYLPGDVIKINSTTGMVGIPEATESGIIVRTLINPKIQIGNAIQLNNKDIVTTTLHGKTLNEQAMSRLYPNYTGPSFIATTSNDGLYRVLVAEHSGDTRDNTWYTDIVCLSIDQSTSQNATSVNQTLSSVEPF
jgi:hypothetical protein